MTIDPRYGFYLSLTLAVLGYLSGASALITTLIGPEYATVMLAIVGLLVGVGNSVNAVLHAIPSKPGPAAASEFYLGPKQDKP